MKYIFLLGKNEILSEQEILSALKRLDYKVIYSNRKENGLLVEINNKLNKKFIEKLGGTISIGEVIHEGTKNELLNYINTKYFFVPMKKLTYTVHIFDDNDVVFEDAIKNRFKQERIRAISKVKKKRITIKKGKIIEKITKNIDEEFFIFSKKNHYLIGKILYNYVNKLNDKVKKIIYQDKNTTSNRMMKILINLAEVREGDMLINPFCGRGSILFESMMMKLKVIGITNKRENLNSSNRLMEGSKFSRKYYKVINDNPVRVHTLDGDSLVSEPILDFIFNKKPSFGILKKAIKQYSNVVMDILFNFKKIVNNRFVILVPFILTHDGKRHGIDVNTILQKTRLKLVKNFPINDFKDNEVVGKQIFVFEH